MKARIAVLAVVGMGAFAQAPARPAFEVATIRPSAPLNPQAMRGGGGHFGIRVDAQRVDIGSTPLFTLICDAYGLRPYQVEAPDWLKNTLFDIQATIPKGVTQDKVPQMLQTLLEERFGLKTHHERKEQPVYALVVAKDGPKMTASQPDTSDVSTGPDGKPAMTMSVPTLQGAVTMTRSAKGILLEMPGKEIEGRVWARPERKGSGPGMVMFESSGLTMKSFAALLSVGVLDKPVVDMTNLKGGYDVSVELSEFEALGVIRTSLSFMSMLMPGNGGGENGGMAVASEPSGSMLKSSIAKLGLALDARKLPLDLLVVDQMEKMPTGN
ncbi:MAG TPA: TIGR03435 family protein [Bryobacteraceae bacterium]|nr:TIGR03435 family protein [Bryobacteraceae bacterium]